MRLGQAKRRIGKQVYYVSQGVLMGCKLLDVIYDEEAKLYRGLVEVGGLVQMEIPIKDLIP